MMTMLVTGNGVFDLVDEVRHDGGSGGSGSLAGCFEVTLFWYWMNVVEVDEGRGEQLVGSRI
jgi:hypothetical protein